MALQPNPTVHTPEEGTYYYRSFWGSYKGHAMGLVRGVLTGSVFGGVIGGVVLAGAATFGLTFAAPVIAAFAAGGALLGADIMGTAGHAAGAAAAATAEEELRLRYPGSGDGIANSVDSPLTGDGHHYETLPEKAKLFHLNVGLPMGALFAAAGALMAVGLAGPMLAGLGLASTVMGTAAFATALPVVGAVMGGVLGASFGVDRAHFKSLFNHSDGWVNGKLLRNKSEAAIAQNVEQELTKEAAEGKAKPVITTLERQDEFHRLFSDYFEKSFWGAIEGNTKGLIGGVTIGAAIGLALGAVVAAAVGMYALPILLAATALGAHEGLHIFTRAGIDGGAQAAAKESLEVKRQRLQKGLDPEIEPAQPEKSKFFNLRTAVVGLGVGVIAGAILGPIFGVHIAHIVHSAPVAGGLLSAASQALTSALTLAPSSLLHGAAVPLVQHAVTGTAITTMLGGTMGVGCGLGLPAYKALSTVSDSFYGGSIMRGVLHEKHEARNIPYLAPHSPWVPLDEKLQKATERFTIPYAHMFDTVSKAAPAQPTSPAPTQPMVEAKPQLAAPAVNTPVLEPMPEHSYPTSKPLNDRIQHIIASRQGKETLAPQPQEKLGAMAREDQRRASASLADPSLHIG